MKTHYAHAFTGVSNLVITYCEFIYQIAILPSCWIGRLKNTICQREEGVYVVNRHLLSVTIIVESMMCTYGSLMTPTDLPPRRSYFQFNEFLVVAIIYLFFFSHS